MDDLAQLEFRGHRGPAGDNGKFYARERPVMDVVWHYGTARLVRGHRW